MVWRTIEEKVTSMHSQRTLFTWRFPQDHLQSPRRWGRRGGRAACTLARRPPWWRPSAAESRPVRSCPWIWNCSPRSDCGSPSPLHRRSSASPGPFAASPTWARRTPACLPRSTPSASPTTAFHIGNVTFSYCDL